MHVEEAKVASAIAMIFGALTALLGALMMFESSFAADAYGSAGLIWGGIAILLAGKTIRRTRVFLKRPRWFFAASLFGISSGAGLYKTILTGDTAGTLGLIPLQAFALYALWRACAQ